MPEEKELEDEVEKEWLLGPPIGTLNVDMSYLGSNGSNIELINH